jgi:DNA polymerase-3 subunit delta
LFQTIRKQGLLVEYKPLRDHQIPDAVRREARALDVSLSEDALALFCRRVGPHLATIHAELQKLALFCHGGCVIDRSDVDRLVYDSQGENVFALTNAIGNGQADRALGLLEGLLHDGEPPLRILTMIVRHVRQLWKAREGQRLGLARKDLAHHVGINPYFLDGVLTQAGTLSERKLARALTLLNDADLQLKSSGARGEAVMSLLVSRLARGLRSGKQ